MPAPKPPRLFIASSVEGLQTARDLQENLEFDAEVTVWTQGIFKPSRQSMADLAAAMQITDFAAFIFSPDDLVVMRGTTTPVARDNVIFELGLFAGHLGIEKCFIVRPRKPHDLHLPSDLLGLTTLDYEAQRSDKNTVAALGAASNKIRRELREFSATVNPKSEPPSHRLETNSEKLKRLMNLWESEAIQKDRALVRKGMPNWIGEDETGEQTEALERISIFLDSVAELLLSDASLRASARSLFESPVKSIWALVYGYFVNYPNGSIDDHWQGREFPPMKSLVDLWSASK